MDSSTSSRCLLNFVETNDVHGLERALTRNRFASERLSERYQGRTALHRAAELDHVEILKALVKAGGDYNVVSSADSGLEV
jgi:hypothetical protein